MCTQSSFPFHYVTPPISTDSLTKGKVYKVLEFSHGEVSESYGRGFYVDADNGEPVFCLERKCSMIEEQDWIVVDYEVNLKKILE